MGALDGGGCPIAQALLPRLRASGRVLGTGAEALPALVGARGHESSGHDVVVDAPLDQAAMALPAQGMRLSVRAGLLTDPFEYDLPDDEAVRGVALGDLGPGLAEDP